MAPSFADTAAADAFQIMSLQFFGADAVTVVQVAGLLALVNAPGACFVQCQTGRAGARERSLGVDADAAAFANARIQVTFVDVGARFAVDFGVADRTVAFDRVAHLARAAPRQTDRTATLGFERQPRQIVLATAVNHFGPARSFSIICRYRNIMYSSSFNFSSITNYM